MNLIRTLVYFCLFCVIPTAGSAQFFFIHTDGEILLQKGVGYIYNVRFDSARTQFDSVIQKYPDHPAGYFLDAMVEWWRINMDRMSRAYDADFLRRIDRVLAVCDRALAKDERDVTALFFKGGALGFRGRYNVIRENYISAATDGKDALDILIACQKIAPGNKDIMLGTGIYNYFAEAIPEKMPLLRPLLVFLPSGDKELGLLQLRAAAKSARYASIEAMDVLYQVYDQFEKNPAEAMEWARQLHARYPDNPVFHRYYAKGLVTQSSIDSMEAEWRVILTRCLDKQFGYERKTAREALYYIAVALMRKRSLDMALTYFYKCDEGSRVLDEDPSGFMVRTNLQIGQIYDLQGKRDLAIKQYNKVLSWTDYGGSHAQAEQYKRTPYK